MWTKSAGEALIVQKDGTVFNKMIRVPHARSLVLVRTNLFLRSDKDISTRNGKRLADCFLRLSQKAINYDVPNTVFLVHSEYFQLLRAGSRAFVNIVSIGKIKQLKETQWQHHEWGRWKKFWPVEPRIEKVAIKDVKLRTFIADDASRDDMVAIRLRRYYGITKENDTLVIIDDSLFVPPWRRVSWRSFDRFESRRKWSLFRLLHRFVIPIATEFRYMAVLENSLHLRQQRAVERKRSAKHNRRCLPV